AVLRSPLIVRAMSPVAVSCGELSPAVRASGSQATAATSGPSQSLQPSPRPSQVNTAPWVEHQGVWNRGCNPGERGDSAPGRPPQTSPQPAPHCPGQTVHACGSLSVLGSESRQ